MARILPSAIELAGYALLSAAAFLTDFRLGLAMVGLLAVVDARGVQR